MLVPLHIRTAAAVAAAALGLVLAGPATGANAAEFGGQDWPANPAVAGEPGTTVQVPVGMKNTLRDRNLGNKFYDFKAPEHTHFDAQGHRAGTDQHEQRR